MVISRKSPVPSGEPDFSISTVTHTITHRPYPNTNTFAVESAVVNGSHIIVTKTMLKYYALSIYSDIFSIFRQHFHSLTFHIILIHSYHGIAIYQIQTIAVELIREVYNRHKNNVLSLYSDIFR